MTAKLFVRIMVHIVLGVMPFPALADSITPFASDGCSSFPDGTLYEQELWLECCVEHDKAYWVGGSYDERLQADKRLRDCVEEAGQPIVAEFMLGGVRAGGSPYFPTTYRWGYGWAYMRGYKKLSSAELKQVEEMFKSETNRETPHEK